MMNNWDKAMNALLEEKDEEIAQLWSALRSPAWFARINVDRQMQDEIARLKKALDSWMSKGQDDVDEIARLKQKFRDYFVEFTDAQNKLAAVRTWFHKLCPRGAESSEMMKLERILGDVGVEKDSPPKPSNWLCGRCEGGMFPRHYRGCPRRVETLGDNDWACRWCGKALDVNSKGAAELCPHCGRGKQFACYEEKDLRVFDDGKGEEPEKEEGEKQ